MRTRLTNRATGLLQCTCYERKGHMFSVGPKSVSPDAHCRFKIIGICSGFQSQFVVKGDLNPTELLLLHLCIRTK